MRVKVKCNPRAGMDFYIAAIIASPSKPLTVDALRRVIECISFRRCGSKTMDVRVRVAGLIKKAYIYIEYHAMDQNGGLTESDCKKIRANAEAIAKQIEIVFKGLERILKKQNKPRRKSKKKIKR